MKKLFLLASVAALALGSCTSELDGPNMPGQVDYKSKILVKFANGENTGSRTTMVPNESGTGYTYVWQQSDAIGLFNNVDDTEDETNAVFTYNKLTSTGEAEFVGQTALLSGNSYYGYYPWYVNAVNDNGTLTVNIPSRQNYNFEAAEYEVSSNQASGNFTQNMAPAVAYGETVGENLGEFMFYPVASYLAFPVTGYTTPENPVKSVTLTIGSNNLAGEVTVDMVGFEAIKDETDENGYYVIGEDVIGSPTGSTSITLNCGSGVTLSDETTWFWFVVPAGIDLENQTISLEINDGSDRTALTRTITTAASTYRNNVTRVFAEAGTKNAFVSLPEGTAIIQKPYQFLEYVNLVTNGVDDAVEAYNTMLTNNPGQASYSYLPSMLKNVTVGEDGKLSNASEVNPALLVNDIELSVVDIKNIIGAAGDGNTIIGSSASLDPYFTYLQDFVDNDGALSQSIGGKATFTMTGAKVGGTTEAPVYAAIDGLTVNGNGFIAPGSGTSTYQANLTNLVLANVTVDATEETEPYYFFCPTGSGSGNTITGVTVQNTCKLLPETDSKGALFNTVTSQGIASLDVTNESSLLYAYSLEVNNLKGFDFTAIEGAAVEDFQIICVTTNGAKSILYVEDADEAEALLDVVLNNGTSVSTSTKFITTGNAFSVVDKQEKPTSYWTGTLCINSTDDVTTAETLANVVQYWGSKYTINLQNNIDLRNLDWWTSSAREYTEPITVTGNGNTISKVNINTNKAGQQYMTMFGASSILSDLTIEDITIDNSDEDAQNAYVAALSWVPGTSEKTSGVTVNGLTVIADKAQGNVMGGLYATLGTDQLNALEDLTLTDVTLTPGEGIYAGNLAGLLGLTTNATTVKITNPLATMEVEGDLFGTQSLNVTPFAGGTTLTLVDFPVPFFSANQINALEGTNEGALLIIKQGTNQTIYTYDGKAYVAE